MGRRVDRCAARPRSVVRGRAARAVDAPAGDGAQLRRARAGAHVGRRPARPLHAQKRVEGRPHPRLRRAERPCRRGLGRARRVVRDVSSRPPPDARRDASSLLRRDPLDVARRDEQRDEHGYRAGERRDLDAEAGQGRAGDVRVRDGRRGSGPREGRDPDLDLVRLSRARVPLRDRSGAARQHDPADRLLPVHARRRGRLGERSGLGRLLLERELGAGAVRERDRPGRPAGRSSACARVRGRQQLDLPREPHLAHGTDRSARRLPPLRPGVPDLRDAGPVEGRHCTAPTS